MSADTTQQTLGGGEPEHIRRADHLVVDAQGNTQLDADIQKNECWCVECSNRVTVGSSEWGHAIDCAHYCWRDDE